MREGRKNGRFVHGKEGTRVYRIWSGMIQRCSNPKKPSFKNYGGRGIQVCERWRDFSNFFTDMGEPPEGMSIERIDNAGDYAPGNCRWATQSEQCRNKRGVRIVSYLGAEMPLATACERAGLPLKRVVTRLHRGWTVDRALSTPILSTWSRHHHS